MAQTSVQRALTRGVIWWLWSSANSRVACRYVKSQRGLQSATGNLNHLGLSRAPSKSNISYQNANRTSQFFEDAFYALFQYLGQHGGLKQMKKRLKAKVCLLDSSLMSLCLEMYDWALYTHTIGAVKMHTVLDFWDTSAWVRLCEQWQGSRQYDCQKAPLCPRHHRCSWSNLQRYWTPESLGQHRGCFHRQRKRQQPIWINKGERFAWYDISIDTDRWRGETDRRRDSEQVP